jgi:hypothetical protein
MSFPLSRHLQKLQPQQNHQRMPEIHATAWLHPTAVINFLSKKLVK